jgi:hypothetical protein
MMRDAHRTFSQANVLAHASDKANSIIASPRVNKNHVSRPALAPNLADSGADERIARRAHL